jgi:hypothetical protein
MVDSAHDGSCKWHDIPHSKSRAAWVQPIELTPAASTYIADVLNHKSSRKDTATLCDLLHCVMSYVW